MLKQEAKKLKRLKRQLRVRAKVSGTATCPRVSVFRSLKNFSAQAIDDVLGRTLAHVTLAHLGKNSKNTVESVTALGVLLASHLEKQSIKLAVFDRSGYRYHGKVKAIAEALRQNGIAV